MDSTSRSSSSNSSSVSSSPSGISDSRVGGNEAEEEGSFVAMSAYVGITVHKSTKFFQITQDKTKGVSIINYLFWGRPYFWKHTI